MKRWNFSGGNATHGNSKAHRKPGSIGNAEFPGKVFKGRKMAGRLGFQSSTVINQRVAKIDSDRSLLYIMGSVPGPISGVVRIRDAIKKTERQVFDLLYPTYVPGKSDEAHGEKLQIWQGAAEDPWTNDWHENDVVSGVDQDDD